ncbi:glycosyltransferase [Qipengyuania atrilutea]|uniref:Glycosyltransferase n=1 Tax=Qipengyuania atrilutea TaxID=2744473 RepID=A0A850H5G9_9SPHN|nr:glycosyltransferase [Actirhodobacter atriluteus]NVD45747.1 glycosyltransferase [Actirhodobacter atriluteus]
MIVYLTSEYPALSHTFIRREISALRERGFTITPYSIRPATIDWGERVESVLGHGKSKVIGKALRALARHPLRAGATFGLAQSHRQAGFKGWLWSMFHWLEALALSDMVRPVRPKHLHSHFANSGATVGMLTAYFLQIPWSLTLHGISETDHPAGALLPGKLERADFVASASWFMRAQAMRFTAPAFWPKYHVIRCGVSMPHLDALVAEEPVRKFITVGRLSAEKGYAGLFEAMEHLKADGIDCSLTIVGDGPIRGAIERDIKKRNLDDRITLLGALAEEDTLAEISKADAFVLASLMEGLPVVLMEAMAAGKPVIAATIAGIPEMIEDGRNGLLFDVGNWSDLGRQMRRLLTDQELSKKLSEAAPRTIAEEFEIARAVAPLAALFAQRGLLDEQGDHVLGQS